MSVLAEHRSPVTGPSHRAKAPTHRAAATSHRAAALLRRIAELLRHRPMLLLLGLLYLGAITAARTPAALLAAVVLLLGFAVRMGCVLRTNRPTGRQ